MELVSVWEPCEVLPTGLQRIFKALSKGNCFLALPIFSGAAAPSGGHPSCLKDALAYPLSSFFLSLSLPSIKHLLNARCLLSTVLGVGKLQKELGLKAGRTGVR